MCIVLVVAHTPAIDIVDIEDQTTQVLISYRKAGASGVEKIELLAPALYGRFQYK